VICGLLTTHLDIGALRRMNICSVQTIFEKLLLCAGVEGPCLHRPENWLLRQLNDEPKPVNKVRFIREKGKATAREE
jgi:hypothetical protein